MPTIQASRRALLIDMEHLASPHGPLLSAAALRPRLADQLALAGAVSYALAVGPSSVLGRYVSALLALRIPLAVAAQRDVGALLVDRARHLCATGHAVLVVSNRPDLDVLSGLSCCVRAAVDEQLPVMRGSL